MVIGGPDWSGNSTVAFLFTDIEQSTRRWEDEPDSMAKALADHDQLLSDAIDTAGGQVFKHTGDGLCAVFPATEQALQAAVDGQRSLSGHTWPTTSPILVRMGVHAGPARRVGDDFFGPTLNRVARVMGAGHGGQTLVTEAASGLVGGAAPSNASLMSLGSHRLRDLSDPIDLYQLVSDGLPSAFPVIRSLDSFANNLPSERSEFIGRGPEMAHLAEVLSTNRMVTLVGPGGVGKTRLALHTGASLVQDYRHGVWMVDLARLSDQGLVATAIMEALGLRSEGTRAHVQTVRDHLASRETLLVLDNCEHLIDSVAVVVEELFSVALDLTVLATSREPLHLDGERIHSLAPLDVEGSDGSAIALFLDRAASADHPIPVDDDSQAHVRTICARLDGLPLAVELAAARVRSMSVQEIAERLDHRFRLLTGGSRGAVARQRTLEATVTWSYEQLDPSTQELFDCGAVFAGGFDLDAAVVVTGRDELDVLDGLDQLVDRSLLSARQYGEAPTRYSMLETMRQYGRDRLAERGDVHAVRNRHLIWAEAFAAEASPHIQTAQREWMERTDREFANIRIALDWACHDEELCATGLAVVNLLGRYWFTRTIMAEAARWIERLRAPGADLPPAVDAETLCNLGFFLLESGDIDAATPPLEKSLAIVRELDDPALLTQVLHYVTRAGFGRLEPEILIALVNEGYDIADDLGDPLHGYLHSIMRLMWHVNHSEPACIRDVGQEFLDRYLQIPSVHIGSHTNEAGAWLAMLEDQHEVARRYLETAFGFYRELGNVGCTCHALEGVAWWLAARGELDEAGSVLDSVLAMRETYHCGRAPFEDFAFRRALDLLGANRQSPGNEPPFDDLESSIEFALTVLSTPRR